MTGLAIVVAIDVIVALAILVATDAIVALAIGPVAAAEALADRKLESCP
jgi:hypothetical protein